MGIRDTNKAATRTKVLDAAKILFEAGGYEAATIRSIAAVAGMSTGAVFASFTDKADVYRAVYGHSPLSPEQGRQLVAVLRGEAKRPAWLLEMAAADKAAA